MSQVVSTTIENDGVKSADRVLALLELFREERRPLGARVIAERLAIPRSSTTVLLRSLVGQGYLRADKFSGTYFPTLRTALLGSWLTEGVADDPDIAAAMRDLSDATEETVCLWADAGPFVQIVRVLPSPLPIALALSPGRTAPLVTSTVGLAMLALRSAAEVESAVARHNATPQNSEVDARLILAEWRAACAGGQAVGYNRWLPDAGAVAVPFRARGGEPLVLAVGGPVFRMQPQQNKIAELIKIVIANHNLTARD